MPYYLKLSISAINRFSFTHFFDSVHVWFLFHINDIADINPELFFSIHSSGIIIILLFVFFPIHTSILILGRVWISHVLFFLLYIKNIGLNLKFAANFCIRVNLLVAVLFQFQFRQMMHIIRSTSSTSPPRYTVL